MATIIRISGVDVERQKGSIRIQNAIEQRSTASFTVVDLTGTASYSRGQPVEILTDWVLPPFFKLQFAGYIDSVTRVKVAPESSIMHHAIQCMDNHYLADKRLAAESYLAQTAGFIVTDLHTNYLSAEGVTIGTIQAGPTILEMVINYQSVTRALDALAEKSGFTWYIDEFKQLFFVARTTTPATFGSVSVSDMAKAGGMLSELTEANPMYRNRQYIRAGRDVTAGQVENFTGDGVTVAFALGYPVNQVPTVTVAAVGQTVGIKGLDTTVQVWWSKGDPVILFAAAPAGAAAIVITYIGEYDIIALVEDPIEITARQAVEEGGTGIVEEMAEEPLLNSHNAAFDSGLAKLSKFGVIGRQFGFSMDSWGVLPGQLVTVTYAAYGLAATELLVESVTIVEFAPGVLRYSVRAIEGPELGDWTGFFKALVNMKDEVIGRLTVGSNQVLVILLSVPETWEWDEAIVENVYTCPIVNGFVVGGVVPSVC